MQIKSTLKSYAKFYYEFKDLILIILGSFLFTYIFVYVALIFQMDVIPQDIVHKFIKWDTPHYLRIATEGYGSTGGRENLIVFFPFYPLLIKVFDLVFHSPILSALVVSNLAYVVAAVFLYRVILLDYSRETAIQGVFFFSFFPTAFFLHMAYTESLFLALLISSFYYARRGKWLAAGLLGMFATATRVTGIVLFPALLIEYLDQNHFKIKKNISLLLLIPLGVVTYLLINYVVFGDFFYFLTRQNEVWKKSLTSPWVGFKYHLNNIHRAKNNDLISINIPEAFFGFAGFVYSLRAMVKSRSSYAAYCFLSWLIFTSTFFWLSIPRYTLTLFPIFISMGKVSGKRGINAIFTVFCVGFYYIYLSRFIIGCWSF